MFTLLEREAIEADALAEHPERARRKRRWRRT
jgi:hypothetical protein